MVAFIVRRILQSALAISIVLTLVFVITHLLGDPVRIVLPQSATPEQIEAVRVRLGLNDPILEQFWRFMSGAVRGDFGDSYWQRVPALDLAISRLPATLSLAFAALVLILPIGTALGVAAALKPGSILETVINILSFMSVSIVDFWLALMMILIFAVTLDWVPTSGYGGLEYYVLPAVTLAVLSFGTLAQVTRASVADEMGKPYSLAASARGVSKTNVIVRHVLRNALIPVLTVSGGILISLAGGAVIAEVVFGWPGLGLLFIQAIEKRDLPLIEATVFVTAVTVAIVNLVVDILYRRVNPKVSWT